MPSAGNPRRALFFSICVSLGVLLDGDAERLKLSILVESRGSFCKAPRERRRNDRLRSLGFSRWIARRNSDGQAEHLQDFPAFVAKRRVIEPQNVDRVSSRRIGFARGDDGAGLAIGKSRFAAFVQRRHEIIFRCMEISFQRRAKAMRSVAAVARKTCEHVRIVERMFPMSRLRLHMLDVTAAFFLQPQHRIGAQEPLLREQGFSDFRLRTVFKSQILRRSPVFGFPVTQRLRFAGLRNESHSAASSSTCSTRHK